MAQRPTVTPEIAKAACEWSHIECLLGIALAVILETEAQTGLAMFLALTSSSNQMTVLDAAAQAKLTEADKEMVTAVMSIVRTAARERNKLVHWCYAISNDFPADLLIIDPADLAPLYANQLGYHDPLAEIDLSKVFRLRREDAEEIVNKIKSAANAVDRMIHVLAISDRGERAEQRLLLSSEPPLAEALRQLRERQKNNPKPPRPPPRRGRRGKR